MNIKILSATTAVALAFSGAQAFAATIALDSFEVTQIVGDGPTASFPTGSTQEDITSDFLTAAGVTADRTMTANNTKFSGVQTAATTFQSGGDILSFNNASGARGVGTLRYDFSSLVDLTLGGTYSAFNFDVIEFDNSYNALFTARAYDGATTITYSENIGEGFDPNLTFAAFKSGDENGAAFDFGNVGWLEFAIDTSETVDDVDGRLNAINLTGTDVAPIPLPASGLLLLAGMGGISLLRRRRKA